jgi:2-methylisocitrate lyase-like PEP mutase family enzyme
MEGAASTVSEDESFGSSCTKSERKSLEVKRECLQKLKAARECRPSISTWHLMYLWKPEI